LKWHCGRVTAQQEVKDMQGEKNQTIYEFCDTEGISYSGYMQLKRKGLQPDELHIGRAIRITPQAKRDWHDRLKKLASSKEAKRQQERRREIGRHAALCRGRPPKSASKPSAKKSIRKAAAEIHA
jgi:hypothetical protein